MAYTSTLTITPLTWSIWLFVGVIASSITGIVARLECKKRRLESTIFVSSKLRITSAVSIGSGLITAIMLSLDALPGYCRLHLSSSVIADATQFVSMGMYQLSRLHYCFSKTSAHHQNGYPKWLFIVMVTIGVALQISCTMLFTLGQPLPSTCGFRRDFTFTFEYSDSAIMFHGDIHQQELDFYYWYHTNAAVFLIWDIIIGLLYCYKIKTFRKTRVLRQDAVWKKIIFILQRIIIITLFYQISFLLLQSVRFYVQIFLPKPLKYTTYNALIASLAILYSISMYMMMEHNTDEYVRFLRCFKRTYLKYICLCCCHRMVDRQLMEFDTMELETKLEETQLRVRQTVTSTWFPNISENVQYSRKHTMNMNVSAPTMTREAAD